MKAFESLKRAFTCALILIYIDLVKIFILDGDAFDISLFEGHL